MKRPFWESRKSKINYPFVVLPNDTVYFGGASYTFDPTAGIREFKTEQELAGFMEEHGNTEG